MRNQLKAAFGNCKYPTKCTCSSKDSFETTTQKEFFIIDEDGEVPVRIVSEKGNSHLTIQNELEKEICLVKTDNCLFTDDTKKCDCILFDDKQLVLAELKISNLKKRRQRKLDAREQLVTIIKLFDKEGIDRKHYKTIALICFQNKEPRIINTADKSQQEKFRSLYNVHLEEKNVFSFS